MTAREVLLAAADHIERHGWMQHGSEGVGKPCCALGAIGAVVGCDPIGVQAGDLIREWLDTKQVIAWNDAPGRTADEVIAALRGAAEAAS